MRRYRELDRKIMVQRIEQLEMQLAVVQSRLGKAEATLAVLDVRGFQQTGKWAGPAANFGLGDEGGDNTIPRTALSVEELQRMKAKLDQDVIDDAEELLNWFGIWGSELIDEVLAAREELARPAAREAI